MVRLALIGWKDGLANIAQVAARLRGGRFTAVVGPDVNAAEKLARALGAAIWTDSFDKLLADHGGEFDAVVWPGPPCQAVATAGKHVLAHPWDGADDVVAACKAAGVRLMPARACRFLPALQLVKESLDAGKLGEPGLLRIHTWGAFRQPDPQVTNEIDLACWLFRQRPSLVYAAGRESADSPVPQVNYVQLHLGFAGGGMALLDYAGTLPPGGAYSALSLIGSAGAAYADEHHNTQLLFSGGHATAVPTRPKDDGLLGMVQEFVWAITEDREPSVTCTDNHTAFQVAEAAAASLATGQAMRWSGQQYAAVVHP